MSNSQQSGEVPTAAAPSAHRHWRRRALVVCLLSALVLGTVGYLQYDHEMHLSAAFYHAAQHFMMHGPHLAGQLPVTLEIARWLGAVTLVLAGFEVFSRLWRAEWDIQCIRRMKRHVIVCGLGRKGVAVASRLRELGHPVVAIDKLPIPDSEQSCRRKGIRILTGDASKPEVLRHARLDAAVSLIAICPDDSTNCEIAAQACELRSASKKCESPLTCRIHVGDAEARQAFQKLFERQHCAGRARVSFFDAFDPEARRLLVRDLPLDHDGIAPDEKRHVHLIILGFGRMGRALAVRAAQLGVFARAGRLKITVIDREAGQHRSELNFHHPYINEVCDIEFHEQQAISPETRKLLKDSCSRRDMITSVAVCFDQEQCAIDLAVQIEPLLKPYDVRVAIRMSGQSGLARLMKAIGAGQKANKHLIPFGTIERFGNMGLAEDPNEQFDRQVHEAYVKMRRDEAGQDAARVEKLAKDSAMKDWDDLPEDFRESNRQQADHIHIKLRALGLEVAESNDPRPAVDAFSRDEIELLAEMEHRRWLAERHMANWTFGPVKDTDRRENPNMQAWEKLSNEIKDYDRVAVKVIPALLKQAGKKICRKPPADGTTSATGT